MVKKRAGKGAVCSIYTRFLHPKRIAIADPKNDRTSVVLVASVARKTSGKIKDCYTCTVDGVDGLLYAAKSHFKLEEEGPEADFFVPLLEKEKEDRRQDKYSKTFQEPKVKWNKSQAKQKLYELIMDGVISDTDNEEEDLEEIYLLDVEFAKYDFGKFKERLSAIRDKIQELNDRAADDLEAFEVYKSNHKPALFSHKGYIQWQGSDAQEHLWDDLADGKVESMKPEELRLTRTMYQEFPLFAFRSKIYQEIRTAKYLRTL